MYKIEKKNYGVKLTFDGFIKKEEMEQWVQEAKNIVPQLPGKFGVLVDMRTLKPLPRDAQAAMEEGQKVFKQNGMERSAVVLNSATVTMQFKKIAKDTGIDQWERYIDASKHSDWENKSLEWIQKAKDPE
jgi:hypothetical protein